MNARQRRAAWLARQMPSARQRAIEAADNAIDLRTRANPCNPQTVRTLAT